MAALLRLTTTQTTRKYRIAMLMTILAISTLLLPELAWSRAGGDAVVHARRGYRLQVVLRGASRAVLSDVSFAQGTAQLSAVRGLHPSGRILLRLGAGATAVASILRLPVSFRLFAGGDQSVRGFRYRSIGPMAADGSVIGGRFRATGSVEFEQMVRGPFGLAVFMDAGSAFSDPEDAVLERGAGFGIRWRSPIGPVRADMAWPLSRPEAGPRFHFVVGGAL